MLAIYMSPLDTFLFLMYNSGVVISHVEGSVVIAATKSDIKYDAHFEEVSQEDMWYGAHIFLN